jgi:sulfofructose kinase
LSSSLPGSFDRPRHIDVLCAGHASYDLIFTVDHHPLADEKIFADRFIACGGGPAANAAVTVTRLGGSAAYAGYLGLDLYGEAHFNELLSEAVDTRLVVRGTNPTPLSAVLVKPDGSRSLVNYKGATTPLSASALDLTGFDPKVILLDGHEPQLSAYLAEWARRRHIPVVLDAGSLHAGTSALMNRVDYLVCSEKFACQAGQVADAIDALPALARQARNVVITLGERGLVWQTDQDFGQLPAFPVEALDTTGAGDAFHGAFALGIAEGRHWIDLLRFASAAGALCCTRLGARIGIPHLDDVNKLVEAGEPA